jgi:hypothetical protein
MENEYILLIPDVLIHDPIAIGEFTLFQYGDKNATHPNSKVHDLDLLPNIQKMLINNGFTGYFAYSYLVSGEKFPKLVLKARKSMAILRYITSERTLTYFLLIVKKMSDNLPEEMIYALYGFKNGNTGVHFWTPGFQEHSGIKIPENLKFNSEHFLLKKFNQNELSDKFIIAIERFNRTSKADYDSVEDILNLTTAFEHLIPLGKGDHKNKKFAGFLIKELSLEKSSLALQFRKWAEEFYELRNQISHGNAFGYYSLPRYRFEYWEDCFLWKHPEGKTSFLFHAQIAKNIFELLLERLLTGGKINRSELEIPNEEAKKFLDEIETKIMENTLAPLIIPNEVRLKKLRGLIEQSVPYGNEYFDIISNMTSTQDTTGDKNDIFFILKFFINEVERRIPVEKEKCQEILKLFENPEDVNLIGLEAVKLSSSLHRELDKKKIMDDEHVAVSYLARFLEKAWRCLVQIAWSEKVKG